MSHLKDCLFCTALGLSVTLIAAGFILAISSLIDSTFYTVALFVIAGIGMAIGLAAAAEMYVQRKMRRPALTSEQLEEAP